MRGREDGRGQGVLLAFRRGSPLPWPVSPKDIFHMTWVVGSRFLCPPSYLSLLSPTFLAPKGQFLPAPVHHTQNIQQVPLCALG